MQGGCLCDGDGVEKNASYGLILLGRAAGMGAANAYFMLAKAHEHEQFGLPKDPQIIADYYRKMQTAPVRSASQTAQDEAAEWLRVNT